MSQLARACEPNVSPPWLEAAASGPSTDSEDSTERSLFFFLGGMETFSSTAGAPRLLPASCRLFLVKEPVVPRLGSFLLQTERWCEGW